VVDMHHGGLWNGTVACHLYALRSFWMYLRECAELLIGLFLSQNKSLEIDTVVTCGGRSPWT